VTPVTIAATPEAITVGAVMTVHPAIPVVRAIAAQVVTVAAMAAAVMAEVAEAINAANRGDPTKAFCACTAALLDSF
jgi:hypothetical protein